MRCWRGCIFLGMRAFSYLSLWLALLLGWMAVLPGKALGQTVVSDDRLSLPDGPGSLEGIGENVEVDPNMGVMRWSVPIKVPKGFEGLTPKVRLNYSSGSGGSVVGMGWSLGSLYIERTTFRGLPKYNREDGFSFGGDQELVRVNQTDPPVYRARFEKAFVRYTWFDDRNDGRGGYWVAEYPDGRKGFFGANSAGEAYPAAQVAGPDGFFRYHLVEMRDQFGHQVRYDYIQDTNVALIDSIGYVFTYGQNPRYSLRFEYEDRQDWLSDCKPGFNELLTKRLSAIEVYSNSERIRRYELGYQDYELSGGFTRLSSVELVGLGDRRHPVAFRFEYSKALGGQCTTNDCRAPYLVDMGSLGLDISLGNAGLVDMNGDALPDVLHTSQDGKHYIHLNVLLPDGTQAFAQPAQSALPQSSGQLRLSQVQLLDTNGDGYADLVDALNQLVLVNLGQGDWVDWYPIDTSGFPSLENNLNFRFFDWDNDKRIDIVVSASQAETSYYTNLGDGSFAPEQGSFEPIGASFVGDGLSLEDMNGDGMLDAVKVGAGFVSYRLNLGYGRWQAWRQMTGAPANLADLLPYLSFVDINGDALADLLLVQADVVRYALNFNGDSFQPLVTLTQAGGQALPDRTNQTVLFADMNGNGSEDVVWVSLSGQVVFLELFPVRPNLLSRISNNVGMLTEVIYGTSVEHMARDGGAGAWPDRLPHSMMVVDRVDTWDKLTEVHEIVHYAYHDGYYDGQEKQFRGYRRVEARLEGDESIQARMTESGFDVGANDPYRNGLLLTQSTHSAGKLIRTETHTYQDCELAGVPASGLAYPVRFVCQTARKTEHQEGGSASEWVSIEERYTYDGYGNRVLEEKLGVTGIGNGGCGPCDREAGVFGRPCGPQCEGDEQIIETNFVEPGNTGGLWLVNAPFRKKTYGALGSELYTLETIYYDGEAFVGLPAGQLTQGKLSRKTARLDSRDQIVSTERNRHDRHGNVVESLDPLGAPGLDGHRRVFTYDADGLRIVRLDVFVSDSQGNPIRLRREVQYEPVFDHPAMVTTQSRLC